MSQIPRRTSEFQASSAKRTGRASTRTTSSALRPSSSAVAHQNRISSAAPSNVRPSTAYPRVSATPMRTPGKTPNRSASRDRMTVVQMTAEKEKAPIEDKEYIFRKSHQILEELSKQDRFNEIVQKGFKSMTLKVFIAILEYFLEPICGSVPKDFQANYIDFLYNLLIQLEYPYNINKSSLKTPNAPHCLNNIIVLLGWLADFSQVNEDPVQYRISEELPDIESVKVFMDQTSEAYRLFNEAKDYSHIEKKIRETYLEARVGAVDVDSEIERLEYEIEQLKKESKPLSLLKELNAKREESTALDGKIEAHNKNIGEFNRKINNLRSNLALKQQAQENVQKELMLVNKQLKSQKMTVEQRQQILIEITHLKSALISKRNAVMELTETSSENEIALSNLISKKYQLIDYLNNLIYKLSSDLDVVGARNQLNPELYELKPTNDDASMETMLNQMHKGLTELKNKYFRMHVELKEHLMKVDSEMHQCKSQNEFLDVKLQQLRSTLQHVEEEESNIEHELTSLIHNIQINYHDQKEKIKQNEKEIAERNKGLEELENEIKELNAKKENFGAKAVEKAQQLYLERKNEVETRREYLRENITAIENYFRNKLTISADLQNLLDRVVAEKKNANITLQT